MKFEQAGFQQMVVSVILAVVIVGVLLVPITNAGNGGGGGGSGGGGGIPDDAVIYNDLGEMYAPFGVVCDYKTYQVFDNGYSDDGYSYMGEGFAPVSDANLHWTLEDLNEITTRFYIEDQEDISDYYSYSVFFATGLMENNKGFTTHIYWDYYNDGWNFDCSLYTEFEFGTTFDDLTSFDLSVVNGDLTITFEGMNHRGYQGSESESLHATASQVDSLSYISEEEVGWIYPYFNIREVSGEGEWAESLFGIGSAFSIECEITFAVEPISDEPYEYPVVWYGVIQIADISDDVAEVEFEIVNYSDEYGYVSGFNAVIHVSIPVTEVSEGVYMFNWDEENWTCTLESWSYDSYYDGVFTECTNVYVGISNGSFMSSGNFDPTSALTVSEVKSAGSSASADDSGSSGGMSDTLLTIIPVFVILGILMYVVQYFRTNI